MESNTGTTYHWKHWIHSCLNYFKEKKSIFYIIISILAPKEPFPLLYKQYGLTIKQAKQMVTLVFQAFELMNISRIQNIITEARNKMEYKDSL